MKNRAMRKADTRNTNLKNGNRKDADIMKNKSGKKTVVRKVMVKTLSEVKLAETSFERSYRNPLTKTFQYEYALYEAASRLFGRVDCRSLCIETLKMYFRELPLKGQDAAGQETAEAAQEVNAGSEAAEGAKEQAEAKDAAEAAQQNKAPNKNTQERVMRTMEHLVEEHIAGKVVFPMMDKCAAQASTVQAKDGTHWFVFTDGIYGFAARVKMGKKGRPEAIEVRDFSKPAPAKEQKGGEEKPAKEQSAKEETVKEKSAKEQPAKEQSAKEETARQKAAKEKPAKENTKDQHPAA